MFERILVAVDGTPSSFAAALFAASMASKKGALHLLCGSDRSHPPQIPRHELSLSKRCEYVLASTQAAVSGRAPVARLVVSEGPVLPAILELEEEVDADLLCVGSGRARLKPGRVSTAVARESRTSVALLREGIVTPPRISHLTVGLRRGPSALAAARRALRVAAGTGARITLLHAMGEIDAPQEDERERDAREVIGKVAEAAEELGLEKPSSRILEGKAAKALLEATLEEKADALFVGSGTRRPLRPLGRVVSRLIATCPVPLVICREELP